MTVEQSVLVAVPRTGEIEVLVGDIVSSATRAKKAEPGDRGDVIRYETLCVQLELLAERALIHGAEHQVATDVGDGPGFCFDDQLVADDPQRLAQRIPAKYAKTVKSWAKTTTVVELRRATTGGPTPVPATGDGPPDVASVWHFEGEGPPSEAVRQRLASQIDTVIAAAESDTVARDHSFNPSGVHNRVLAETFRQYVAGTVGTRVDAPVSYRDGSQASNPFPFRCLNLSSKVPKKPDVSLDLALLSIRHTEMDPIVDGAWLRNSDVSRPRPAALTDDYVYATSVMQLRQLTNGGNKSLLLRIYQTGLDTAIVGFYRAVVTHLLEHPTSLVVIPMFHANSGSGEAQFQEGEPWAVKA